MKSQAQICQADLQSLTLVGYPDPRLRRQCTTVQVFDKALEALIARMFEVMFDRRGIGLAAPQVGLNARIFVASPSFQDDDRKVYVNPEILFAEGQQESEEGCLSLPGLTAKVKRFRYVTIRATDPSGEPFEETLEELPGRAYLQHEIDHLDGRLLIDRMGSVALLTARRLLKDLEKQFTER